ncbi:MAG: hypothetical protein ACI9DC_005399 [Gammaproteobacteria bacterium]|jgi:hypothetical protein
MKLELHHSSQSPYDEEPGLILGLKSPRWRLVIVPTQQVTQAEISYER